MSKLMVYVAEPSRILSKVISTQLEAAGYETQVFTDGLSVLKKIVTEDPSLIICDRDMPLINGLELCSILKTGSSKPNLPVILISADEKIFDFWSGTSQANKVISISSQNVDSLIEAAKELLDCEYVEAESFLTEEEDFSGDEKLISWLVNSMGRNEGFLNMTRNVVQLYPCVKNTGTLVQNIFKIFYTACEYDIIALILDGQSTYIYTSGTENFSSSVLEDFSNICKTEYAQQAKKNHTVTFEEIKIGGIINSISENSQDENQEENSSEPCKNEKRLESYYSYVIKTDKEFVGTLHLAATRKKIFNYKVQSSIEFVLPSLANILQESVQRSELSLQERKLRSAFSKFIPEQVMNDLLNSNSNQELNNNNEKRNVVILMCDIRNFTSISEINKAEDVVNFLNTYFTHMVDIVKKYGGTVDKFVGDAVMVLFGAPISYNDNAKRAVAAAIEMFTQLDKIPCGQLKFPEGMKLDIGIGIHYGEVIVGQIGSADKTNYTVIGDTVNVASRLEGLTKLYGARLIISEAVYDELDDSVNALLLDSVKVKGKKASVQIYRVDEKPLSPEFTEVYEKGFKSYNEGAFSLAIPYFEKALEYMPQDKAARLMLDRCNEFSVNKPEKWDGAIALTSK